MGASYHQFCPVSKAMELLDERWTLLVLRELISGSEHFNDLRRGLPRMSPSLLSKRLRQLARAGVVDKRGDGGEVRYLLTPAGRELRPIIEALGAWGTRWIGELGDEDLDPQLLLWDMHRNIDHAATPAGRTVVQFRFPDLPVKARDWWLVITPGDADVCDTDPGYPVTVTLTATLRHLTQLWRGDLSWPQALRTGALQVNGPEELRRAAPGWFTLSPFASVPRPGDEQSMALPARSPGQRGKDRNVSLSWASAPALTDKELAEINQVAATGDDPEQDTLILRLHTETACRRAGALAIRPRDLDREHCLVPLREKGETSRWQPVSPTLMAALVQHAEERHAPPDGQLLRYRDGRQITERRYDGLWVRLGRELPWVRTQEVSTHWIRHTTLTWVAPLRLRRRAGRASSSWSTMRVP